jgi:hypothetical protein
MNGFARGEHDFLIGTDFRHYLCYNADRAKHCVPPTEKREMAAARRRIRRDWSKSDLRTLKTLARQKTPARRIGGKLKRSEGAVRQKAYAVGISLNTRRRRRK